MPLPVTYSAREDSGTANNPALNLTSTPALELTFVAETDSGDPGDLFLDQPAGGGVDPDTQVEIGGTSYSFTYEFTGTLPTQKKDGAQQVPDQYEGSTVVLISVQDYPSAGETTRFAFMPDESASLADMDDFGNGRIAVQNLDDTPPSTPICFLKGSGILTPEGEVPVENLRTGDLVMTADDGPMPIRWISCTRHQWPGASDKFRPILIQRGALGSGRPHRDLAVSPQHRMLLRGNDVEIMFGDREVLAPSKGLVGGKGIRWMKGKRAATYYHILLDRHCILKAEGALTESFYPGRTAVRMLTPLQRREIISHFPSSHSGSKFNYGPLARRSLTCRETENFVKFGSRFNVSMAACAAIEHKQQRQAVLAG